MAFNGYQVPDLASVLQTLATLAPQTRGQSQLQAQTQAQTQVSNHGSRQWVAEGHGDQSQNATHLFPPQQHNHHHPPNHHPTPYLGTRLPVSSTKIPSKAAIDPTTIIDWPSGLSCVMKTIALHDNIIAEIKRMIKQQDEHEQQWWTNRQALIAKQEARVEGQKRLDDVLKAVGGATQASFASNTPIGAAAAAEELKTFDLKVYRAQLQMIKEMSTALKNLGVPFFGTRSDLVVLKKDEAVACLDSQSDGQGKRKIGEGELVQLQRRMLGILEELCQA